MCQMPLVGQEKLKHKSKNSAIASFVLLLMVHKPIRLNQLKKNQVIKKQIFSNEKNEKFRSLYL